MQGVFKGLKSALFASFNENRDERTCLMTENSSYHERNVS